FGQPHDVSYGRPTRILRQRLPGRRLNLHSAFRGGVVARIYHDNAGAVLRFARTKAEEATPAGAAGSLAFDETTNAALAQQIADDPLAYLVSGGQLRRGGQAVAIAADSASKQERDDFDAALTAYLADMQTYLGIADSATNVQVRDQVKRLTQGMV